MASQNNRILITGATGCIGTAFLSIISNSKKYSVVALSKNDISEIDNTNITHLDSVYTDSIASERPGVTHIYGDICDESLMRSLISKTDFLIHLAAKVHSVPTNQKEEEEFFRINCKASETIFKLAAEYKLKKVVFLSTVAVYGKNTPYMASEDNICNPETAYSKSKLYAEEILTNLHNEKGLPMTILRPVTVFGHGDRGNLQKLINLARKGLLFCISGGHNKKSFIYSKDIALAILDVIHNEISNGKVYNVKGFEITVRDLNRLLTSALKINTYTISIPQFIINLIAFVGKHIEFLSKLSRNLTVLGSNNFYSSEKLKKEIGFKALYSFEDGLNDSLDYYLQQ